MVMHQLLCMGVMAVSACLWITATSPASAADKPAVEAGYFLGESKMTTPDGKHARTSLSLVKRVVNQTDSRIEEYVLTIGEKDSKEFVAIQEVKGNKCP